MRLLVIFACCLGLLLSSCSRQYIPNTDVEESDFNRRVIEFCEEYRHAVERRNIALLLKLAHPSYYEDGGNIDTSDDLDYAGLKQYLEQRFREVSAIRYEIRYREVSRGRDEHIYVDFTYSASYKLPAPEGPVWRRRVADNRLELVQDKDTFRIVAGM
ncbi:MAG TPA: hypothetical protein VGP93_13300 [Polyangiaceae bacterium]|nr:hypothetical protein [Polyangiaceae bacterium]